MEGIEFFLLNGKTYFIKDEVRKELEEKDRDEITFLLEMIKEFFPQTLKVLEEWAADSKKNNWHYEYRMVDRFIRCNFAEADFLHADIELGVFQFEEVKCPLRGICKHEGIICKPKANIPLSEAQKEVVELYAKGFLPKEIASKLGKSESTCKVQLWKACTKLKLPHPRWLIRLFSIYSYAM